MFEQTRLKDFRRLAARGALVRISTFRLNGKLISELETYTKDHWRLQARLPADAGQSPWSRYIGVQELDRLIGRFGPDAGQSSDPYAQPEGEARPKETQEVVPAQGGDPDSTIHGGDGNSGEVDAPAQTSTSEQREGNECRPNEGPGGVSNPQTGKDSDEPPDADLDASSEEKAAPQGPEAGEAKAIPEPGQPPQAASAASGKRGSEEEDADPSSDTLRRDASGRDREDEVGPPVATTTSAEDAPCTTSGGNPSGHPVTDEDERRLAAEEPDPQGEAPHRKEGDHAPLDEQNASLSVRAPLARHGGTFSDSAKAWLLAKAEDRSAREVIRALEKLLKRLDIGGLEPSPRVQPRRLVTELTSRRYNLARTARTELALPLVVLACDESGSCSTVCQETLAACLAVAERLGDGAAVVRHSNGWLSDPDCGHYAAESKRLVDWCRDWSKQTGRPIGAVVAFGDWDAGHDYRELCEDGAGLVWLDSYCAKDGVKPASCNLREGATEWKRQPLAWFQGINNPKATAIALRQAARTVRSVQK